MDYARNEDISQKIKDLEEFIENQYEPLMEYEEVLVRRLIKRITVKDVHFAVEFKSGLKIDVAL